MAYSKAMRTTRLKTHNESGPNLNTDSNIMKSTLYKMMSFFLYFFIFFGVYLQNSVS